VTPALEPTVPVPAVAIDPWPQHARRVASLEDLVAIYESGVSLVTAPLDVSADDQRAMETAAASVPCFEFARESGPSGEPLEYALPWFEGHAGGEAWLCVARPIVEVFADLFEAERVGVRLTLADRPMCPRFHVDNVVCRLVATFVGRGSEFLDDRDVRRKLLGAKESPVEREGAGVHQLERCEVGLFKGEAWPQNKGRGIVHRSPPGTDRRLVMTVDLL
jgi:hypothetical protein